MAWGGRVSLKTIRYWLAGLAVALLLLVAGLIGYARYKVHRLMGELPGRLGVHITQESDNVTYSQSYRGRTVYTVHAKKQIQRKDGVYTLRDVGMVLYGAKGDRADRIHGSEFEYDQKNGVLKAVGEVFLDLGGPGSGSGGAAGAKEDVEKKMIHVKTSGLTFLQKERSAATEQELEFAAGGMTGRAVGATYDSGTGVVVLQSAVKMSGLRGVDGSPMVLTAARAEMDRVPAAAAEARGAAAIGLAAAGNGSVVRLEGAQVTTAGARGEETMAAQHAVVWVTEQGNPTRVDGAGDVVLSSHGKGGKEGRVTGQRLAVMLNAAGQMKDAQMMGDVRFAEDGTAGQARGQAGEARVVFDGVGRPVRALLTGGVGFDEMAATGTRRLDAEKVDLALGGGGKERVVVRGAVASGANGAKLRMVSTGVKGQLEETTVRGDVLTARMNGGLIAGLDGAGKTEVTQVVRDGVGVISQETSDGAGLRVDFHEGVKGRQEIARAEQGGAVTVVSEKRGKAGMETTRARGETAVYEAGGDRLVMSGGVQVADAVSTLAADTVEVERGTGDATAVGTVKVMYEQGGQGEPVHVVAGKAVSKKGTGVTEFTGGPVRMWQGGSQVEARVMDFDREKRTLVAKGGGVKAVLAGVGKGGVVRVSSGEMTYGDAARVIELKAGVTVVGVSGTVRADGATVTLAAAPAQGVKALSAGAAGGMNLGGKVERMVGVGGGGGGAARAKSYGGQAGVYGGG